MNVATDATAKADEIPVRVTRTARLETFPEIQRSATTVRVITEVVHMPEQGRWLTVHRVVSETGSVGQTASGQYDTGE